METAIILTFFFPNHKGPGDLALGFQKILPYDMSFAKEDEFSLCLFKDHRIDEKISKIKFIDRGEKITKQVTVYFKYRHSVQHTFNVETEQQLKEEMMRLGYSDERNP